MANKLVPVETPIIKINIAGYLMDDLKTFDPTGATILCRLGEVCGGGGLQYFPHKRTIIIDSNQQSTLFNTPLDVEFIPKLAEDLQITHAEAIIKSTDYFEDKTIMVQPVGIQGKAYSMMRNIQNMAPMYSAAEAVSILKTTGLTGAQIISKAPLTFVGVTYIGSMFFGYFGSVAGNNTVGLICNGTSYILSRPMRGVEITLNGLIFTPLSNFTGIPFILNGTQEILAGKGLKLEDYAKIGLAFERLTNSTVVKKVKEVYNVFRKKDS